MQQAFLYSLIIITNTNRSVSCCINTRFKNWLIDRVLWKEDLIALIVGLDWMAGFWDW